MEFYIVFTIGNLAHNITWAPVSFSTEQEAKDFLRITYEKVLCSVTKENAPNCTCVGEIADDGRSAKITEKFSDHTDVTAYFLAPVKTPEPSVKKPDEDTGAAQPAKGDSTPLHLYAMCPNCGSTSFLHGDDDGSFKCLDCGAYVFPEDMGLFVRHQKTEGDRS